MDFCKAFDTDPHNILLSKLERDEADEWTVRWVTKWLDSHIQRVVVNGSESQWTLVTSGVPQGSILGPVLVHIFISTRREQVYPQPVCRWHTWRTGPSRETWTSLRSGPRESLRFNKARCWCCIWAGYQSQYWSRAGQEQIESSPDEKGLGVLVDERLHTPGRVCWHPETNHVLAASKEVWAAGQGRRFCPSSPLSSGPTCSAASSSGVLSARQTRTWWSQSRGGHQVNQGDGAPLLGGKAERIGFVQPGKQEA